MNPRKPFPTLIYPENFQQTSKYVRKRYFLVKNSKIILVYIPCVGPVVT